jgi:hypothetical protein
MISPLIIAAAAAAGAIPDHPLHLDISNSGDLLVIRVVGESRTAWSGRYALEVSGGPPGASNRSVQRGAANIQPGSLVTVATLSLGSSSQERWVAHLDVSPASGAAYQLEWRSR